MFAIGPLAAVAQASECEQSKLMVSDGSARQLPENGVDPDRLGRSVRGYGARRCLLFDELRHGAWNGFWTVRPLQGTLTESLAGLETVCQ